MRLWLSLILAITMLGACEKAPPPEPAAVPAEAAKPAEPPVAETAKPAVAKPATPKKPAEPRAVIETTHGKIEVRLFPDVAPNHVKNFQALARKGFYDGTTFHRVIPGFMIQGGDPNTRDQERSRHGTGGPGYTVKAEFNARPHVRGTLSMARARDPDSAGSQFFICLAPQPSLDRQYTVFGEVVSGMEVVDKIAAENRDGRDNPINRVEMKVRIK